MSAFLVSDYCFSYLAEAIDQSNLSWFDPVSGLTQKADFLTKKKIANILKAENLRSLIHRYPEDGYENEKKTVSFHKIYPDFISDIQVVKSCHCLKYQSCETEDYNKSHAYAIVDALENHFVMKILQKNGYPDAIWDLAPQSVRANRH